VAPSRQPGSDRWLSLLAVARLLAATGAAVLLVIHRVSAHDDRLLIACVLYTAASLVAFGRSPAVRDSPLAWAIDSLVVLMLMHFSEDWRSPFFVLSLTTLVLPTTSLGYRAGLAWSAGFTLAYVVTARITGLDAQELGTSVRLETLATHLMVPIVVALALAYAARVLRRLGDEQRRSERLAVQSERQRIAWELHDSAKQRLHAATLLLTAYRDGGNARDQLFAQAMSELDAAGADMQTSVAELRDPLPSRPIHELLSDRARELRSLTAAHIDIDGACPAIDLAVAAHVHRIVSEALTNAVRHADASRIRVGIHPRPDRLEIHVVDDGRGMPSRVRAGANGLRSMRSRAQRIGARLDITSNRPSGTLVALSLPIENTS
jgi:signal transduction histidine kinase